MSTFPLYNMEVTSFGIDRGAWLQRGRVHADSAGQCASGGYGSDGHEPRTSTKVGEAHDISVTVWGVPAAHEHDAERGEYCDRRSMNDAATATANLAVRRKRRIPVKPFLSNPTSCGAVHRDDGSGLVGGTRSMVSQRAQRSRPDRGMRTRPVRTLDRSAARRPAPRNRRPGWTSRWSCRRRWENPYSIATANLKDTTVTLPEGITVNPSARSGLGACTPAQYEAETSGVAAGRRVPAGIEDRVDRNRNAGARGKDPRRDLYRHAL